jgi:hypothetical protein
MISSMAIVVLISVALLASLFWLIWRRRRLRAEEKYWERSPVAGESTVAKSTGTLEIERATALAAAGDPRGGEEESGKDLELPEKGHPSQAPAAAAAEVQNTESHLFGKTDSAVPMADSQTETHEELSSASSAPGHLLSSVETSMEHDESAAHSAMAMAVITVEESSEEPTDPADATPAGGNGLSAEYAVPETAVVSVVEFPASESTAAGVVIEEIQAAQETEETEKAPQRYRPPVEKPPRQSQAGTRRENEKVKEATPSEVSLGILVRLTFDRLGLCDIALLPERTSGLDNEVALKFRGMSLLLEAQDDWYEDVHLGNIGSHLRDGVELKAVLADQRPARWLLTGRDLYVLARHPRASGFVSTNRLALGRSHVVLCPEELLPQVEAILKEAECEGYTKLAETDGIPSGWVGLRGVTPAKAIALDLGSDPFYAIKPAPDIEINLDGGICLRGSVWLSGYPPEIKLFGESGGAVKVLIDGKEAKRTSDDMLIVDGYDVPGQHTVYCQGLSCSRTYSIEEGPDSWQRWPAYQFGQADVCGPLVQPAPDAAGSRAVTVPMSNPVLLGAQPGEIFYCSRRGVARWKGFVPFEVVWALPAQPLRCDKKSATILQLANAPVVPAKTRTKRGLDWSIAILDASRKGLRVENGFPDTAARWREYKKMARNIWRAGR